MQKWLWIVVLIGGSIAGITGLVALSGRGGTSSDVALVIQATDWSAGNVASPVTLTEYSDFQCPACGAWEPLVREIIHDYGNRIRFIYRHFPLPQHQNADLTARAAEAAGIQGKFWEMHDVIFDHQKDWSESSKARDMLVGYARELKLDIAKFEKDMDSDAVEAEVRADKNSGLAARVNATPTFFVNGRAVQPRNPAELRGFLDDALKP